MVALRKEEFAEGGPEGGVGEGGSHLRKQKKVLVGKRENALPAANKAEVFEQPKAGYYGYDNAGFGPEFAPETAVGRVGHFWK